MRRSGTNTKSSGILGVLDRYMDIYKRGHWLKYLGEILYGHVRYTFASAECMV